MATQGTIVTGRLQSERCPWRVKDWPVSILIAPITCSNLNANTVVGIESRSYKPCWTMWVTHNPKSVGPDDAPDELIQYSNWKTRSWFWKWCLHTQNVQVGIGTHTLYLILMTYRRFGINKLNFYKIILLLLLY